MQVKWLVETGGIWAWQIYHDDFLRYEMAGSFDCRLPDAREFCSKLWTS